MTVKKKQRQPDQRKNPTPALHRCFKHQQIRTKTRRQRKKASLLLKLSSVVFTDKRITALLFFSAKADESNDSESEKEEKTKKKKGKGKKKKVSDFKQINHNILVT